MAVVGEDLKEVSPGCLPRTLDEMRAGRAQAEEVHEERVELTEENADTGPGLDETLDQMFANADFEELATTSSEQRGQQVGGETVPHNNTHAQAISPAASRNAAYRTRRISALRRELGRMRSGIDRVVAGLRELGETVPDQVDALEAARALDTLVGNSDHGHVDNMNASATTAGTAALTGTDRALESLQVRLSAARWDADEAKRRRDEAARVLAEITSEHRAAEERCRQLQREQRTAENYVRTFGTREEFLAAGEDYESPVAGMFNRAMTRFRAAEAVRREERTLRQVLEDERRHGVDGARATRRLSELANARRDFWGVPHRDGFEISDQRAGAAPAGQISEDEHFSTLQETSMRDLLVDGAGLLPSGWDMSSRDSALLEQERIVTRTDIRTPPVLVDTEEEAMMREQYALLRTELPQDFDSTETEELNPADRANFPSSMLDGVRAARARELNQRESTPRDQPADVDNDPNGSRLHNFNEQQWWQSDAEHIMRTLAQDEPLRNDVGLGGISILGLLTDTMEFTNNRATIDAILRDDRAIWRLGLPKEWLRRRKEQAQNSGGVQDLFFSGAAESLGSVEWAEHHNTYMRTEVVAQAYMMSAEVRRHAPNIMAPARLQILYRLQRDDRSEEDVRTLELMRNTQSIFSLALDVFSQTLFNPDESSPISRHRISLDEDRQMLARHGDHSREGLDVRRRATSTSAFALAAGRQAMQTSPEAVMAQVVSSSDRASTEGMRAFPRPEADGFASRRFSGRAYGYRQLTLSDYLHASESDTDTEREAYTLRGLDAEDSNRPEPKTDEELTISLECKICYTQMAEVACLPCGHLVMCRWCSDQHSPSHPQDRTRPRRTAHCPMCRKGIRQKVRVYRA